MFRHARKFIAVLLAIWLPLNSGNALAMSVFMPNGGEANHSFVVKPVLAHASSQHHQAVAMDHCAAQDDSANNHTQSDPGCKHPAACQLAVAAGQINVDLPALSLHATPYLTLFQSQSVAPLDPPPLASISRNAGRIASIVIVTPASLA